MPKETISVEEQAKIIIDETGKEAIKGTGLSEKLYHENYMSVLSKKIHELGDSNPELKAILKKNYDEENNSYDPSVFDDCCVHGLDPHCCPCGCGDLDNDADHEPSPTPEEIAELEADLMEENERFERLGSSYLENIGPIVNGFYRMGTMEELHKNFLDGKLAPIAVKNERSSNKDKITEIPFNKMFDVSYVFCGRTEKTGEHFSPEDFNIRAENIAIPTFHGDYYDYALLCDFIVTPVFKIKEHIADGLNIPRNLMILPAVSEAVDNCSYIESMQLCTGENELQYRILKTLDRSLNISDRISGITDKDDLNPTIFEISIEEIIEVSEKIRRNGGAYLPAPLRTGFSYDEAKKECVGMNQKIIDEAKTFLMAEAEREISAFKAAHSGKELPELKIEKEDIKVSGKREFANVFMPNDINCINTMMNDHRDNFNHDGREVFQEPFGGAGSHLLALTKDYFNHRKIQREINKIEPVVVRTIGEKKNKSKMRAIGESLGL